MKFSNAFAALCTISMSTKQGGGLFRSAGAVEPPSEAERAFRAKKFGGDRKLRDGTVVDSTKSSLLRGGGGGERKLADAMTLANLLLKPAGPGVIQPTIVSATTQGVDACRSVTSNGFQMISNGDGDADGDPEGDGNAAYYYDAPGYAPLGAVLGGTTYDHCGLQIQFQCPQPTAQISLGFSFTYEDTYNDGFGIFLNGGLIGLESGRTRTQGGGISPAVGLTQPGINTLQLSIVDLADELVDATVEVYKGTLECRSVGSPGTTFHVWNPVSDTELFQLQNNSVVCINSTSYNIEARYPSDKAPQTQVKLLLGNNCNATTKNSGWQTELVAPYFVYGDEPNSGDVFRNPKSKNLINCAWTLSAKADSRPVEKLFFTQRC